jgi:hypothetical protein
LSASRFPHQNVTYGYRRNLLGLKLIGLLINGIVLTFCILVLWFRPPYFASLANLDEKLVIIVAAVVLHSVYLLIAVGKKAVRDASRVYGRQLILSCDTLMKQLPTPAAEAPRAAPIA